MTSRTFNIKGMKIRTRSNRRYVVVALREDAWESGGETYVPFTHIIKRTDNINTARKVANRYGWHRGAHAIVIDTIEDEAV